MNDHDVDPLESDLPLDPSDDELLPDVDGEAVVVPGQRPGPTEPLPVSGEPLPISTEM